MGCGVRDWELVSVFVVGLRFRVWGGGKIEVLGWRPGLGFVVGTGVWDPLQGSPVGEQPIIV